MKGTGDSASKNSFIMMLTTLCSRVFGLVRTMILSRFLGTGSEADIFYLAFKIPNLFRRLFAEGSISAAFIPIYSSLIPAKKKSSLFFSQIFTLFFIFLILFILAFELFSPGIMMLYINPSASSKNQELWTLSVLTLRIMFPYLFFISLSAILQGVLNSRNHFFSPAFTPILLNLSMIGSAGLALVYSCDFVITLSYGVLIGGCLQFVWLLPFLFRYHKTLFTFKLSLKKYHHLKKFFILMLPVSFSAGIYQINQLITDFIAYPLGTGSISSLQYSRTLQEFPLGVIIISVSTICLPLFHDYSVSKISINYRPFFAVILECCFL